MLKTSNIQRGSNHLKTLSKKAKQAHSLFVGADALVNHVQHNKAFSQNTRDHAKNARYITSTLANLTTTNSLRRREAATADAKKSQQKFTSVPRNIPTHPHIRVPSSSNPSDDEVLRTIQGNWIRSQGK